MKRAAWVGLLAAMLLTAMIGLALSASTLCAADGITKYVRFQAGQTVAYGLVEGDRVRQIEGDLFGTWKPGEQTHPLSSVKLLVPVERPSQVLALAGAYKSHLGGGDQVTTVVTTTKVTTSAKGESKSDSKTTVETEQPGQVPTKFQTPQFFFKSPSCLVAQGENVVIPSGTSDVHFEAELVIVISREAKHVSEADAPKHILGVTCGNDISARDWQKNDVQWWRAKGSDTFGPVGPMIVAGLNYDDLRLRLRLNGETKLDERTSQLIHNVAKTVSFASQHVTLKPGDLIFTGTPGRTSAIKPGDRLEVELEGVGVLANPVVAGR